MSEHPLHLAFLRVVTRETGQQSFDLYGESGGALRAGASASVVQDPLCEMLKNQRYIGKTVWGCTRQVPNPETGRMEKRYPP
jgi:hypothetical protein